MPGIDGNSTRVPFIFNLCFKSPSRALATRVDAVFANIDSEKRRTMPLIFCFQCPLCQSPLLDSNRVRSLSLSLFLFLFPLSPLYVPPRSVSLLVASKLRQPGHFGVSQFAWRDIALNYPAEHLASTFESLVVESEPLLEIPPTVFQSLGSETGGRNQVRHAF